MSFVQTGFLLACAAASIPILVHLLSRWQVRTLELGTARFLQEVVRDGAQRRKIQRWFLLLTRMALLLLLALLFARPFLPLRTQRSGERLRIVLVDRSASMGMPGQAGRLVDDAVSAASAAVAELGNDPDVLWAWFDRHVEPLSEAAARPTAPRAMTSGTDYLSALRWARDRLSAAPERAADVVLVTDLQQSGLQAEQVATDALRFPPDVPVRIIDVGRPAANNLSISGVSAPAVRIDSQQKATLTVTLFNYGTLPFEEVPLIASAFDGSRTVRLRKSLSLAAGQAADTQLDFGQLDPGTWQITVALDVEDDLAADNQRQAALQVAEPLEVLVLDSGSRADGIAAESFYLGAAIEQPRRHPERAEEDGGESISNAGRFRASVVFLEDSSLPAVDAEGTPLVVVANAGSLASPSIRQLEKYVREGGRLLVFAGEADVQDAANALAAGAVEAWQQSGLAPGELGAPQRSGAMPFRITSLSQRGAMLEPFHDPQHGDLSRLAFHQMLPVSVTPSAEVLAAFDSERPALTRHPLGSGHVVWFLSSADTSWGSWPTSPLYLPLVQQMAGDLLDLTGEGPIRFRTLGDPQPLANPALPAGAQLTQASFPGRSLEEQGLTFSQPGFLRRDGVLYVVNGSERESDPMRIEPAAFAEHFGLTLAGGAGPVLAQTVDRQERNELWPWFAAAVFVLCVVEFSLANRTSA